MKKQFKVISLIAIIALVISFSMVGCTTRGPARPNTPYNNQLNRNLNYTGDGTDINRNMNTDLNNRNINDNTNSVPNQTTPNQTVPFNTTTDQATKIADKVTELKEVKNCTVAISGDTALVGVSTADNVEGKMTTALKDRIDKVVKEADTNIKTVHVTANADLYRRIENVGNGIRTGKPLSGFATEIEELIRRITPTTR
ncbi:YhcN/YlaJ family sporulation lipoprotein [Proteiniborus sp. MB09-C3]|uniref:YhcN/YlaJ family sporulation lipoprotein n=1 Tax=Proteiniborus sp. MB09-C3 TaxID=3050072 RepID=UPI002555DCE7|nr:YhcN/YlaJ family sporulation lipoprotein [Proteiniborus sp. MB09-C3]WIV11029.1 YhcN/YlaJ family sporulation lipoprotein [Proteiniborus sp. MB09-C3]